MLTTITALTLGAFLAVVTAYAITLVLTGDLALWDACRLDQPAVTEGGRHACR